MVHPSLAYHSRRRGGRTSGHQVAAAGGGPSDVAIATRHPAPTFLASECEVQAFFGSVDDNGTIRWDEWLVVGIAAGPVLS